MSLLKRFSHNNNKVSECKTTGRLSVAFPFLSVNRTEYKSYIQRENTQKDFSIRKVY